MSKNNSGILQSFLDLPSTTLKGIGDVTQGMIDAATGFVESVTEMFTARKHTLDTLKINSEYDLARQRIESEYARESKRLYSEVEKERLKTLKITLLKDIEAKKTMFIRQIEKDEKVDLARIYTKSRERLAEIHKEEELIKGVLGILTIATQNGQRLGEMEQLVRILESKSSTPLPSQLPPSLNVRLKDVTFSFYLPNNDEKASLIADFTEWTNWRMVNSGNDNWCITVSLPPGDYRYGFSTYSFSQTKYDQLIVSVPEDENTHAFVFCYEQEFGHKRLASLITKEEKIWVTGDFVNWIKTSESRLMSKNDEIYHVTYSFTARKPEYQFKFFSHSKRLHGAPSSSRWIPDSEPDPDSNLKLRITKGRATALQSGMSFFGSQPSLQSRNSRLPTKTFDYQSGCR